MQWLANISVRRAVLASVLMLTLVVVGLAGKAQLGVDKFPKIDFPFVTVTVALPGATPAEIESQLAEPLEGAINTVSGLEQLTSISTEGAILVMAQFVLEKDPDIAAQEVRDRISSILRDLPEDATPPEVKKLAADAAPVVTLAVRSDDDIKQVSEVADKVVRRRLESINGVGLVRLLGARPRQINVRVDPMRLRAAGVTALQVQQAILAQNRDVPGGRIDEGPTRRNLRLRGRVSRPEDLGDIVVKQSADHPILLSDVATIEDGVKDLESAAIHDGTPAVVLSVLKQSGENTVAVVDRVKEAAQELEAQLPPGYHLDLVRDNSALIRASAESVQEHLVLGAVFAALVVLVFLGDLRSTIIAAIAIPVSIVGTYAVMWYAGFTLNQLTLLALALAVGIVIDDAIVVLENIHRFIAEKNLKPFPAAILATREIGPAVLATTLSLLAVFLPVAFMSGIVGRFLASFGLTMAFAIATSLFVSFTATPMLSARWLRQHSNQPGKRSWLQRMIDGFYQPVERLYVRVLRFCMRRRWVVIIAIFVSLGTIPVTGSHLKGGFLPESDDGEFTVYLQLPSGTSVESTELVSERIARQMRALPFVESTLVSIGDSDQKETNIANVYVRMAEKRKVSQADTMERVRKELLAPLAKDDIIGSVQPVNDFGGGAKQAQVMYVIRGPDLDRLESFARTAVAKMREVDGIADPSSNVVDRAKESVLQVDHARAAALGVNAADVAATVRLMIGGLDVTTYEENGEQYQVHVQANRETRTDPEAVRLLTVPSSRYGILPLSDVITFEQTTSPAQINHLGRMRQVTLYANVAPGSSQGDIAAALEKIIDDLHMPPGYTYEPIGQAKEMAKTMRSFGIAFLMTFIFMYLVLAAQFESWLHPLTIMVTLPLTLPFALASLLFLHQQINMFSMLGLLVLFGVVKKNAILQIEQSNQLRAAGMPKFEAIIEANRQRLRPILMTTLAFVAGMMPLVFAKGAGSAFSQSTSGIIVGGQTLSLALTLLATPVLYSLFDGIALWFRTLVRKFVPARGDDGGKTHLDALVADYERKQADQASPTGHAEARMRASTAGPDGEGLPTSSGIED